MRLILFLTVAISIYTAIHVVVYWGMRPLLTGHSAVPSLVWAWMGIMIVAPIFVRVFDRMGYELVARALAWVGFSWMGFVFLAFSVFVLIGTWEVLVWVIGRPLPALSRLSLHGPLAAAVVLLVTLMAGLYGFLEARNPRVETVTLSTEKLGADRDRLRIVQVSDLHLGLLHREEALAPVVARIRELDPDLVVATGDVVDAQIDHLNGLSELWGEINPPLGKFAVTGNHEAYAGLRQALDFLQRSGFTVLRNEGQTVEGVVTLVGVDDPAIGGSPVDEATLLEGQRSDLFTLLLKHRPRVAGESAGRFDLQLSGHAHRGQIFPFNLLTGIEYPMQNGLYDLGTRGFPAGGHLYTSRGTGTWGPPMRVLAPPEITLFEIVSR